MHWQIASDATDHIIIYGSKLDECAELIKEIDNEFQWAKEIVFMSENKQIPPEIQKLQDEWIDVDYISWKPDNQSTLELANIQQAKSFILLTEGINSDNKLISYIMKVRLMRTDIFIIAEICDSRNYQPIFKKAWVNKIIDSWSIGKNIITRTLSDQIDVILQDILWSGDWHEIYRWKIDSKRIDKPFWELKHHYADSHISVLAVVDIWSDMLHYNAEHILSSKSEIFYLADERLDSI